MATNSSTMINLYVVMCIYVGICWSTLLVPINWKGGLFLPIAMEIVDTNNELAR